MSHRTTNKDTNLDDWETDPDFVRDMDEVDQRWGRKRTVGSINMNELIEDVRRDHKTMQDKFKNPSQSSDYSQKGSSERHRGDLGSEKFSKDSSKDISREYVRSSESSSYVKETNNGSILSETVRGSAPPKSANTMPQAFKSIQDKIDAFKKEFDDIEYKVLKKHDISELIKKTTNVEKKSDHVQYVTRSNEKISSSGMGSPVRQSPSSTRPTSASPSPGDKIKSMSERFEMLNKESSEDFKRRMEERRKEFFDRIQTQVRETRKGLDGFDVDDSDNEEKVRSTKQKYPQSLGDTKQFATRLSASSPFFGPQSTRSSADSINSQRPKVYTKRETTQEEVVSTIIKENDKIIHDETKRNVERTSSCHGSSEDEMNEPQQSSIKSIDKQLRTSPQQRMQSPTVERTRGIPVVEHEVKGGGLMARTLYDYQAAETDELSFDVDDLITNIEKIDQGWYKGTITRNGVKRVGLFPANYVKLLNDRGEY